MALSYYVKQIRQELNDNYCQLIRGIFRHTHRKKKSVYLSNRVPVHVWRKHYNSKYVIDFLAIYIHAWYKMGQYRYVTHTGHTVIHFFHSYPYVCFQYHGNNCLLAVENHCFYSLWSCIQVTFRICPFIYFVTWRIQNSYKTESKWFEWSNLLFFFSQRFASHSGKYHGGRYNRRCIFPAR